MSVVDKRPEHLKNRTSLANALSMLVRIRNIANIYINLLPKEIITITFLNNIYSTQHGTIIHRKLSFMHLFVKLKFITTTFIRIKITTL